MSKSTSGLVILAAMALALSAQVSPKAVRTAAEMDPLLASIAKYEYGQSRVAQAEFTQFVQDSLASPALLKQIEARLLTFVQSEATAPAKQFALREISLIGTDASVAVLTPMVLQPATSEMARFALARIPGPAVDQALRDDLAKSSGNIRIGIVESLAQRRDAKAVPALVPLSASSDQATAEAAVAALADIADRPSLNALSALHGKASGTFARRVSEAWLKCADRTAAHGDTESALKVYKQLLVAKESPQVRAGALTGIASISGKAAVPTLAPEVESKEPVIQRTAIKLLGGIPGADVTALMQREFPKLSPTGKVRLLSALAERGDKSAQPLFTGAVKDPSMEVRAAALEGLGALGDSSSIAVLADVAATGQPVEQTAARVGLIKLHGAGIDAALASAIAASKGAAKAELILAAGERGTAAAADVVLKAVQEDDPDVRREALRAAKSIAGPQQIPALVSLVTSASKPADRRDAGQALVRVLERSAPDRIAPVIAAYKGATAVDARVSLIEVFGRTSNEQALALLRSALSDPTQEIVRGSILALSEWNSTAPLPDLLAVARSNSNQALQVLALRGYLKLVGLPSQRPNPESARLLSDVVGAARQPAEKIALLALLPNYPCAESRQIAESMLKDEAVGKEAQAAIDRLNGGGRGGRGGRGPRGPLGPQEPQEPPPQD
jgi:HEAT repeat protein